ncbi:MAG: DUF559 domain-containing protein [bacterium]|nr:DUF559 domain-containing protein [bacterium]
MSVESRKQGAIKSVQTNRLRGNYKKSSEYMKKGGALKALLGNCKTPRISKPQIELYNILKKKYPDAILDYPIGNRLGDVAIPSLYIVAEYDGQYWHQNKEKDTQRDKELQKLGWYTIRYDKHLLKIIKEVEENSFRKIS